MCVVDILLLPSQIFLKKKRVEVSIYNYHYPHQRARLEINDKITIFVFSFFWLKTLNQVNGWNRKRPDSINYSSCYRFVRLSLTLNHRNVWVMISFSCGFQRFSFRAHTLYVCSSSSSSFNEIFHSIRTIDIMARYRCLLFFDADPNVSTTTKLPRQNGKTPNTILFSFKFSRMGWTLTAFFLISSVRTQTHTQLKIHNITKSMTRKNKQFNWKWNSRRFSRIQRKSNKQNRTGGSTKYIMIGFVWVTFISFCECISFMHFYLAHLRSCNCTKPINALCNNDIDFWSVKVKVNDIFPLNIRCDAFSFSIMRSLCANGIMHLKIKHQEK